MGYIFSLKYITLWGISKAMNAALITVVETKAFTASAKGRMTQQEVGALINVLAAAPECGT